MTDPLQNLIEANRSYARKSSVTGLGISVNSHNIPKKYGWIGCSDNQGPVYPITWLESGEIFVHCSIANMMYSDLTPIYQSLSAPKQPTCAMRF